MGTWRSGSLDAAGAYNSSAARRIDTTYCTVSELSGTYRILLVLVILQWSSVFHTRVRDRGLCTDNAFYIPALRPLSLLHGDMSKVRRQ